VAVDEHLRADGETGVYALGDAAAWWSRRYGRRLNVQHWDDAYTAPTVVAHGIVNGSGAELVHDPVPYFWSDQFGHRVEYVGHHDPADTVTIDEYAESSWTAQWHDAAGELTARWPSINPSTSPRSAPSCSFGSTRRSRVDDDLSVLDGDR